MSSYREPSTRAASLGLAAVLLVLGVLTSLAGFVTHQAGQRVAQATVLREAFERSRFGLSTEIQRVHEYVATRNPRSRTAFYQAAAEVSKSLESVRDRGEPDVSATGADLLSLHQAFIAVAERAFAAADAGEDPEVEIHRQIEVDPLLAQLRGSLGAWVELLEDRVTASVVELERITLLLWLGTPTMILVGMLILYRIWIRIQAQQQSLRESTHRELEATRRTERRFDALLSNASDMVVLIAPDRSVVYESSSVETLRGYMPAAIHGPRSLDFVHQDDRQRTADLVDRAFATAGRESRDEVRFEHADGSWRCYEVIARCLVDNPELDGVILTCHDITQRKAMEAGVRASEAKFRALVQSANDAVVVGASDGTVVFWNASAEATFGYTADDVMGQPISILMPQRFREAHERGLERLRASGAISLGNQPVELVGLRKDGTEFPIDLSLAAWRSDGGLFGSAIIRDITARKELEEELRRLAFYDTLSGLPNRSLFSNRLEQALARGGRHGRSVAVLFLDLDNFKVINDSLGHSAGDRLLKAIADRLIGTLRAEDTVARFGGDEFAVLLEEVHDVRQAHDAAERIAAALRTPISLDNHEICPSFSVGIALSVPNHETAQEVLRHADLAMYRAKANGKAQQAIFDQEMAVDAMDRLVLEADLRHAIPDGELRIEYQPIVEVCTGAISEVEALVRWDHPRRGWMAPARFVPLAEETGLIVPMGHWVLEQACRRAQEWRTLYQHARNLIVSVNISALQFRQPTLVADVGRVLAETGLPPNALKLEITESVLMQRGGGTITTMHQLKDLGVKLAIDDYGTGYSSLAYLKQFPVDTLKIDRAFVDGVAHDHSDGAIVRSIVALARSLSLKVTAEGVESAEQLRALQELGCDQAQGFYFAKPGSADVVSALLECNRPLIQAPDGRTGTTAA